MRYVKENNLLNWIDTTFVGDAFGFGFSLEDYAPISGSNEGKFLTNSPSTLYAQLNDYGTLPFLAIHNFTSNQSTEIVVTYYKINMYDSSDSSLGNFDVERTENNGAFDGTTNITNEWSYIIYWSVSCKLSS